MPSRTEWSQNALTPYRDTVRPDKKIATVDLETRGLGGDFIYGGYAAEGEEKVTYFSTIAEWAQVFLSRRYEGYIWYAHNGGEYDYKYLLLEIRRLVPHATIRLISQGSTMRLIGAKISVGKHRFQLRDSLALMPCSLHKFLADFAPAELQKGSIAFDSVEFNPANPEHIEYLRCDVLGLLVAMLKLRETIKRTFNVPLGWTAGATAMLAWRRTLAPGAIYWRGTRERDDYCRQAYHGGLVTLASNAPHTDMLDIDVNAMYAHSMRLQGVPSGRCAWADCEVRSYPGIYHCKVNCPESQAFTFLPYIHPEFKRLCWPTGVFSTYLTTPEIECARAHGIDVNVCSGVVWEGVNYPFNYFINLAERLELSASGQDSAIKSAAKILRNSLYGKLGARPETTILCFEPESPLDWEPVVDEVSGEWYGLWSKLEEVRAPYIHPEWAAFTTARARIVLSNLVYLVGPEHCIYTDTDSLKVRANAPNVAHLNFGRSYGEVKLVDRFSWLQCGGPKNYLGLTEKGEWKQTCKGIPLKTLAPDVHMRALNGENVTIEYLSMNASRRVVGMGAAFSQYRQRTVSALTNSRGWRHMGNGRVRPIHVIERVDSM